jgi:hypothetical protein
MFFRVIKVGTGSGNRKKINLRLKYTKGFQQRYRITPKLNPYFRVAYVKRMRENTLPNLQSDMKQGIPNTDIYGGKTIIKQISIIGRRSN